MQMKIYSSDHQPFFTLQEWMEQPTIEMILQDESLISKTRYFDRPGGTEYEYYEDAWDISKKYDKDSKPQAKHLGKRRAHAVPQSPETSSAKRGRSTSTADEPSATA